MNTMEITGIFAAICAAIPAVPIIMTGYRKWKRKNLVEIPFDNREVSSEEGDGGIIKLLLNPHSARLSFIGREDQKDSVLKKCRESEHTKIEYIVLHGKGGTGKTRLAVELCNELNKEKTKWQRAVWDTGFLKINPQENEKFFGKNNLENWWNVRNTLLVIDEVSFLWPRLWQWLILLDDKKDTWKNKLVLVLIDRDTDWLEQMMGQPGCGEDHPICRRLAGSAHAIFPLTAEEAGLLFNSCMDIYHQSQKGKTLNRDKLEEAMKICKEGMLQEYRKMDGMINEAWRKRSFYIITEAIFRYDLLLDSIDRELPHTFTPRLNGKRDLLAHFAERDREKLKTIYSEEKVNRGMQQVLKKLIACQMLTGNNSRKFMEEIFQRQKMGGLPGNELEEYQSICTHFIKNSISLRDGLELNPIGFYFVADSLHLTGDNGEVDDELLEVCFMLGGKKTWENWSDLAQKIPELSDMLTKTGNRIWKERLRCRYDSPEKWNEILSACCSDSWCCKAMEDIVRDLHSMKVEMARNNVVPGDVDSEIPLACSLYAQGAMLHACSQDKAALPCLKESLRIWRRIIRQERNASFTGDFGKTFNTLILCLQNSIKTASLVRAMGRIIPLLKEAFPKNSEAHEALANSLALLGYSLIGLRKDAEAEAACKESVELWETLDHDNPSVRAGLAGALKSLGVSWRCRGEYGKAEPFLNRSVNLWETLDQDNPAVREGLANALNSLGLSWSNRGEYGKAEPFLSRSVKLWETLDQDNPSVREGLAVAQNGLGISWNNRGGYGKAEPFLNRSVKLWEALDQDNPSVREGLAMALNSLGISWSNRGEYGKAEPFLSRSVKLWETLDQDNPAVREGLADALNSLGLSWSNRGEYGKAEPFLSRSVALWETSDQNNPLVREGLADALNNLGLSWSNRGEYVKAESFLSRSVTLRETSDQNNPLVREGLADALNNLGLSWSYRGEYGKAESFLSRSVALREMLDQNNTLVREGLAMALNNLGLSWSYRGEYVKAESFLSRSVALWETLDQDNPSVRKGLATALNSLGLSWSYRGGEETAEPFLSRSVKLWEILDQGNPSVREEFADTLDNLGISLIKQNIPSKLNEALSRWRQAITVLEKINPKGPRVKSRLAQIYIRLVIAMDKGRKGYENEMFLFCSKALKNYSELEKEGQKDDWNHSEAWRVCACLCKTKDIQRSAHACNKCITLIKNVLKETPERAEEACWRLMDICLVLRELGQDREYDTCLNWVMELSREIHRSDLWEAAKQMLDAPHGPKGN